MRHNPFNCLAECRVVIRQDGNKVTFEAEITEGSEQSIAGLMAGEAENFLTWRLDKIIAEFMKMKAAS